jgi:hypothetical protein
MKGRTRWRHMIRLSGLVVRFLSTLPRGERPASGPLRWLLRMVSIHAPARGATPTLKSTSRSAAGIV